MRARMERVMRLCRIRRAAERKRNNTKRTSSFQRKIVGDSDGLFEPMATVHQNIAEFAVR